MFLINRRQLIRRIFSILLLIIVFSRAPTKVAAFTYNNNLYFQNDLEQNVYELIIDGLYQAYCASSNEKAQDFTNEQYTERALNFQNAYVSLLRNKYGETKRLSSTEAYFGFIDPDSPNNKDPQHLNIKNSFYANITTLDQQCVTRIQMLQAIMSVCENKDEEGQFTLREECETFENCPSQQSFTPNPDCDLYEAGTILGNTTLDRIKLINQYVIPYHTPNVSVEACHDLMTSTDDAASQKGQIRDAMLALPLYSNDTNRIGYILEATKLCQPCRFEQPTDECDEEDSTEFARPNQDCDQNLKWEPDMLRAFPFTLPNVLVNAHTNSPTSNYQDPSHYPYQAVTSIKQQEIDWQRTDHEKNIVATASAGLDVFEPINRQLYKDDPNVANTLALMVNKTGQQNEFNQRYLIKEGEGNMRCEAAITPASEAQSRRVVSDAANAATDPSSADFYTCRTWYSQDGGNSWNDCANKYGIYENSGIIECAQCGQTFWVTETDANGNEVLRCQFPERKDWTRCTSANLRWWAITPNGYDAEKVELGIRALYAQEETWTEAEDADPRLTKRVALLDYTGGPKNSQLGILGGQGATDALGIQGFLYPYDSEVWKKTASCKNLEDYYLGNCNGQYATNTPDNQGYFNGPAPGKKVCEVSLPNRNTNLSGEAKFWYTHYVTYAEPANSQCDPTQGSMSYNEVLGFLQSENMECATGGYGCLDAMKNNGCKWCKGCSALFIKQTLLQGTGQLKDGTLVKYTGDYTPVNAATQNCYGSGACGGIVPFRTVAAPPNVPCGTTIYLPNLDGITLQDGTVHDGCLLVTDRGSAIQYGDGMYHLDIYAYNSQYAAGTLPPSDSANRNFTGRFNDPRCDQVNYTNTIGVP